MIEFLLNLIFGINKQKKEIDTKSFNEGLQKNDEIVTEKELKSIEFKDNSIRLKNEFNDLKVKNPTLYDILIDLNEFANKQYSKNVIITMIFRSDAEQDFIYKDDARYLAKPFKSPHQFWHGVDIRSWTFSADEITEIEEYLNSKWNKGNYYKWVAKCHNVGHGDHFHIQFGA